MAVASESEEAQSTGHRAVPRGTPQFIGFRSRSLKADLSTYTSTTIINLAGKEAVADVETFIGEKELRNGKLEDQQTHRDLSNRLFQLFRLVRAEKAEQPPAKSNKASNLQAMSRRPQVRTRKPGIHLWTPPGCLESLDTVSNEYLSQKYIVFGSRNVPSPNT